MAESSDINTIIEEREELMVSPTGESETILRAAHFLKPLVASIDEPVFDLPSLSPSSLPPTCNTKNLPLKVTFSAWRNPGSQWIKWVHHLCSKQQFAWKKAGIYEAIICSTYDIRRYNDLLFGLAEIWNTETNTFVFLWGEATITLEDVIVLGGYSALGSPVSCSVQNREWKRIEEKLSEARREITSKANKTSQNAWINKFMDSGSDIEHEAFLSAWLSRFVIFDSSDIIKKHIFSMAIHLAKGISIALAPAVLVSIYRDLSLLKKAFVASTNLGTNGGEHIELVLNLHSPFHLVQLWAWERFQALQPNPNFINYGDPRSARWNKVKYERVENVMLVLDSAGESFQWRPYAKCLSGWRFPKFYNEKEEWMTVDSGFRNDLESFVRCLRVSKLIGIDCVEQYFPHRVAMQFGLDQDLPGSVAQSNETPEDAWTSYCKPISNTKLYVPSRLFESNVTTRYLKWWKQSVLGQKDANKDVVQQPKSLEIAKEELQASKGKKSGKDADDLPGFPPKGNMVEVGNSAKANKAKDVEMLSSSSKHDSLGKRPIGDGLDDGAVRKLEKTMQSEHVMEGAYVNKEGSAVCDRVSINDANKDVVQQPKCLEIAKEDLQASKGKKSDNNDNVQSSFPPKGNMVEVGNSSKENKAKDVEMLSSGGKHDSLGKRPIGDGLDNGAVRKLEKIMQSEHVMEGAYVNKLGSAVCDRVSIKDANKDVVQQPKSSEVAQEELQASKGKKSDNDADVPPGFPPKGNMVEVGNSSKENKAKNVEMLSSSSIHDSLGKRPIGDGLDVEGSSYKHEIPGLELEAKISRLERMVAEIKARRVKEGWFVPF